jgi:hypothetical protein
LCLSLSRLRMFTTSLAGNCFLAEMLSNVAKRGVASQCLNE